MAAGSKWEVLILHEHNRVNLWGALASLWTTQSKGFYVSELDPEAPSRKDSVFHTDSIPTASSRAPAPKGNSQAPPGLPSQSELRKEDPPFWHTGSLDMQRMWK